MVIKRDSLKEKREEIGYSQGKVAELAGISRSQYTRIELGTRNPSLPVMRKIAAVLEVDLSLFFPSDVPFSNRDAS